MKEKKKFVSGNVTQCSDLETAFARCFNWEEFEKQIRELEIAHNEKCIVKDPWVFIRSIFLLWQDGRFTVPPKNTQADLFRFIHTHFYIHHQNDVNKEMSLSRIKTIAYETKG